MKTLLPFLLFCLFCSSSLISQYSIKGHPKSFSKDIRLSTSVPTITFPAIDLLTLQAEDAVNDQTDGLYRFAYPFLTNTTMDEGIWETLDNGDRVWRIQFDCPGAHNMNVIFSDFYIPDGGQVFLYGKDKKEILGAFGEHNNRPTRSLATAVIYSDRITVEYYEPKEVLGQGSLIIGQVAHGYRGLTDYYRIDESGNCQVNINCSPEGDGIWQDHKKGAARILINGGGLCSGSLINNTSGDCTPYFLTANHCISGSNYDAVTGPNANIVFYWNYERAGCANTGSASLGQTSSGATVVANDSPSDFALLQITGTNPNDVYDVYFNGWDRSGNTGSGGKGIHHPAGDIKKISTHSVTPSSAGSYWELFWDATANGHSVTEGGSSGSPLFRSNGRIIGQLFGGSSLNCSDPANDLGRYGKVSYSWTNGNNGDDRRRLDAWLDPSPSTGVAVLDGAYDPCANPEVVFVGSASEVDEELADIENACEDYQLISVQIKIGIAPSQPAFVTLTDLGTGTATPGRDYEITTTEAQVLDGTNLVQDFFIEILDDAIVENTETIDLGFSLNSNAGNATNGSTNQTYTITITNTDFVPASSINVDISNANFESDLGSFTTSNPSGDTPFSTANAAGGSSSSWTINGSNASTLAYVNDDGCNCNMADVKLISPSFDLTNFTSATFNYDVFFENRTYNGNTETAEIQISLNGGSWSSLGAVPSANVWTNHSVDLNTFVGNTDVRVAIQYSDAGGWLYGLAADNIVISGDKTLEIQSTINTSSSDNQYLGPLETVHFFDPINGYVMATIENLSDHDFGCTEIYVDKAGNGETPWLAGYNVTQKNYRVIPSIDNPSAPYNITLYFKSEELPTWQTYSMVKSSGTSITDGTVANSIVSDLTTPGTFGTDQYFTGEFSGFSGFALSDAPANAPLPVELLSFTGEHLSPEKGNLLQWQTASEVNVSTFELQRSKNGRDFATISTISAAGNSAELESYQYQDKSYLSGSNYYRLKVSDLDASFEYSEIVEIKVESAGVQIYPNPLSDVLFIEFAEDNIRTFDFSIHDALGSLIRSEQVSPSGNKHQVDVSDLAVGVYLLTVDYEQESQHFKVVVR